MASITLLRHAALPLKYQKRYIGHSDISIDLSLTDISKLDFIKNSTYDIVYSSDLLRCMQTLDLINISYLKDSRIREVKFKDKFEAKSYNEIENMDCFEKKYLDSMTLWHEYVCEESFIKFKNRINEFINELPKNKNILICSHAGALKMIHSQLENINYESNPIQFNYIEPLVL